MKRLWLVFVVLVLAACVPQETGTLEGHVSMTMQAAVQPGSTPPTPAPEAYAVRQVVIFTANGKRESQRVQIDGQGNYQAALPVGTYVVDVNHTGMDRGIDLPATVVINAGEVTRRDIHIDTGIR